MYRILVNAKVLKQLFIKNGVSHTYDNLNFTYIWH